MVQSGFVWLARGVRRRSDGLDRERLPPYTENDTGFPGIRIIMTIAVTNNNKMPLVVPSGCAANGWL